MGAGLVAPTITSTSRRVGDHAAFTVSAGAVTQQSWTLTATDATGAVVVRTITGSASQGQHIAANWDELNDAGVPAAAGAYTLSLTSAGATGTAVPYTTQVTLHPPVELTGPTQVGYGALLTATGSTYPGSTVTVMQAPAGSPTFAPVGTVTTGRPACSRGPSRAPCRSRPTPRWLPT